MVMKIKSANAQIRLAKWASIIKDCETSGLYVTEYCRQHNLSHNAYYYWLRKVNAATSQQVEFVELPKPEERVVPVTDSNAQLTIKTGGTEVSINNDAPTELVTRILEAIRYAG